ncbi:MAG: adenylate/guanylate cyclase domain-containing protein [Calditrichaeota bacterium]|nr:MAG: adenylate/guanylate cyclase domain-containing protein [Calditrichota bacterium]
MYHKDKIQHILRDMHKHGAEVGALKELYRQILLAPPEKWLLLNPNVLAVKMDMEQTAMLDLIILGVLCGLFEMQWDMACPHCHGISDHSHDIAGISPENHCEVCKTDYENFADETVFVSISLNPALFTQTPPAPPSPRKIDPRVQSVTALDMIRAPLFRTYFSSNAPAVDQSVKIRSVTVLFTDLIRSTEMYSRLGDMQAYTFVKQHFDRLFKEITAHSGGVIKTIGDAVMAIFREPTDALKAAFALKEAINKLLESRRMDTKNHGLRVGISSGTALIVNMNDVLDLFGTTVNVASRILKYSESDSIAVSTGLINDAGVSELVSEKEWTLVIQKEKLKGVPGISDVGIIRPRGRWLSRWSK